MKILYLHQYFTTPEHAGGVRSYQFARRLVERGISIDMVTSSAFLPTKKKPGERFVSIRNIDGITVHVIHTAYANEMSFLRRIFAFLAFTLTASFYVLKIKKPDLVYATSTPLTIGIPGLVAKYYRRIPMVFEVRDLWPDVPIAMGIINNAFAKKTLKFFERLCYKSADKIVVLSEGMDEELREQNIPHEKLVLVPNACDIKEFDNALASQTQDSLASFRANPKTKVCIYAGTLGLVNNIDYLIALAKQIRDQRLNIHIVIIGSGSQKPRISQEISQDETLGSFISILDPVPKKELIPYINSSDACISTVQNVPALYNNSANKFFDALAAGRPIIINHGGWQSKVINSHALGIVLDSDIEDSTKRLDTFLRKHDKDALERKIKSFAQAHYSRELLFERLYEDAILPALAHPRVQNN